ncbi:MAG TPA: winged helix-turn-helix domain-containing protein, partial [Pyrinomonadaceae bacterium]|nr:winged helix-turn-helix domain-containing protein [Pyrinomonadaceae bacterium]
MVEENGRIYSFDCFTVDAVRRVLLREDQQVPLPSRAFDLLIALVESGGRALSKEELMQSIWADQIVEDSNLTVTMANLRKALGEKAGDHRYIVTIPGLGYRFIGKLRPQAVIIEEYTRGQIVIENDSVPASGSAFPETGQRPVTGSRSWLFAGAGAIALIAILAAGYFWWSRRGTATAAPQIRSIAVLPFKPLVAEGRDESLELGMADTLIARLSNLKEIDVRPISAVRRYGALDQDPVAAGREQKVDAVLDGSIQKAGDRIRVRVRLARVENGAMLWTDTFDDKLTDIFTVEDSISERVAGILVVKLTGEERSLVAQHSTNNPEAYQLYLRGRYFLTKRTGEDLKTSIDCFNQAIAKDPNYARAYAGLADSYILLSNYNITSPEEAYSKARAAVTEALRRDDKLAEAHDALADIKCDYDWDFAGAEQEYKKAIALDPNYAESRKGYGEYLALMGRANEALVEIRRAQELEPLSLLINRELGTLLYFGGRTDESIDQLRKTLELDTRDARTHIELGYAFRQKRQYQEALAEFKKALEINPEESYALSQLAHTYGLIGQKKEAEAAIKQLQEMSRRQYVLPSDMATAYAGLGDKDRSFEWLEKAYHERDDGVPYLGVDPSWDPLRSD